MAERLKRTAQAVVDAGTDWGILTNVDSVGYTTGHVVPIEAGPSSFASWGREPVKLDFLGVFAPFDFARLRDATASLLRRVGISKNLSADASVRTLSGGKRQSIAIFRAMQFSATVIILDEPTNNLGVEETQVVLRFIKDIRDAVHSVLFITHNIHHVFEVADRIAVMRQGEVTAELVVNNTDLLTVESIITGADVSDLMRDAKREVGGRDCDG